MAESDKINYYIEPVEIEIYLKKAGLVRTIIKDMYVDLIDVEPINDESKRIFDHFKSLDQPIDLMEVMNAFPQFINIIFSSYSQHFSLFEKVSMHYKSGLAGSVDSWRLSLYFTELLLKYEPTVASSKFIGDFQMYNLNYMIRTMNKLGQKFLLEDSTVSYLIKRRNQAFEGKPVDKEFAKLVELWQYNIKKNDY